MPQTLSDGTCNVWSCAKDPGHDGYHANEWGCIVSPSSKDCQCRDSYYCRMANNKPENVEANRRAVGLPPFAPVVERRPGTVA